MNHADYITHYVQTIIKSTEADAVLIEGPPGWGKTTTVRNVLNEINVPTELLGTYSTPLNLFNFLFKNAKKFALLTIALAF